jgi:hypothetical protein
LVVGIKKEGSRARDNQSGAHFKEISILSSERSLSSKSRHIVYDFYQIPNQMATYILSSGFTYSLHAVQKGDTCST